MNNQELFEMRLRESDSYHEAMRLIGEIKALKEQISLAERALKDAGDAGFLAQIDVMQSEGRLGLERYEANPNLFGLGA